jgi:hypothetical protein
MTRIGKIGDRFPKLYRTWEKDSLLYVLLQSISDQIDKTEYGIADLMKAHWIDTAEGEELDKLGLLFGAKRLRDEDDAHLRTHLKRAVDEYKGGGTVSVILDEFRTAFKGDKDLQIIENPPDESFAEFLVVANDTWFLGSNSIKNEEATLSLTVEGEGQVSNPSVTNVDTGESITFNGQLKKGEKLVLQKDCAMVGDKDVTENVMPSNAPFLFRKGSNWKYSEALLELIGVFDGGKFDENTFALGVPTVRVRFDWTRQQPATFMVQVKSQTLADSGLSKSYLEKTANYLKAAGVNAIIKVME